MKEKWYERRLRTAVMITLLIVSCGGPSKDEPVDTKGKLTTKKAPQSPLLKKLLTLKACSISSDATLGNCKEYRTYKQETRDTLNASEVAAVGQELISSASPPVRLEAAKLLQNSLREKPGLLTVLIEKAKTEKDKKVLVGILRMIGARAVKTKAGLELLIEMSHHKSEIVRQQAIDNLMRDHAKSMPGAFDAVRDSVDHDTSIAVRAFACARLYGNSDNRAIAVFEKYLYAHDTPDKLYESCWKGLVKSWVYYPRISKPSEEGYRLTMKVLKEKERSVERPHWSGISIIRSAYSAMRAENEAVREWRRKVSSFYKPKDLIDVLWDVFNDNKAATMTRTTALRTLATLAVPRKKFVSLLKKRYARPQTPDDEQIMRQLRGLVENWNRDQM